MKTKAKHTLARIWRALFWIAIAATVVLAALAAAGFSRTSVAGIVGRAVPVVWAAIAALGIAVDPFDAKLGDEPGVTSGDVTHN